MKCRAASRFAGAALAVAMASSVSVGGLSFVDEASATVVIQRTTIYINTLPKGCVKTEYNGGTVVVWKCGSLYYQPYQGRYVRVYVKVS